MTITNSNNNAKTAKKEAIQIFADSIRVSFEYFDSVDEWEQKMGTFATKWNLVIVGGEAEREEIDQLNSNHESQRIKVEVSSPLEELASLLREEPSNIIRRRLPPQSFNFLLFLLPSSSFLFSRFDVLFRKPLPSPFAFSSVLVKRRSSQELQKSLELFSLMDVPRCPKLMQMRWLQLLHLPENYDLISGQKFVFLHKTNSNNFEVTWQHLKEVESEKEAFGRCRKNKQIMGSFMALGSC